MSDKVLFLALNPDKILINKNDYSIKFIETGLFAYLFKKNLYNNENYNNFNYSMPNDEDNFDFKKNNIYSLSCIFYFVLTGEMPYNKMIGKSTNENLFANLKKFNFNHENIKNKKVCDIFSNFLTLHLRISDIEAGQRILHSFCDYEIGEELKIWLKDRTLDLNPKKESNINIKSIYNK